MITCAHGFSWDQPCAMCNRQAGVLPPETGAQIDALVAKIKEDAYRQGWSDAITALRRAALNLRYTYPNGFAGLPEHLHPSSVSTLQQGPLTS